MKEEIKKGLEEVSIFHPEVTTVVYSKNGQYRYMDDNLNAVNFDDGVNLQLIDDASDSVEVFPSVYYLERTQPQTIAVIDQNACTLTIYNVPEYWDSEQIEAFLFEGQLLHRESECSWGEFDGEIIDKR